MAVVLLLACAGAASADAALPPYAGGMTFPNIQTVGDPEEYSWEVSLSEGEALEALDERSARVYLAEDGHTIFTIEAIAAHDADGTTVPTSLTVVSPNVITLFVHHRAGDPAKGGIPFDYPVIAGEGWEGGLQTEVVLGPPDEQQEREERERREREEREAPEQVQEIQCLVPRLKGLTIRRSKRELRQAHCAIGRIAVRGGSSPKRRHVVRQSPRAGARLAVGGQVDVVLGVSG